MDTFRPIIDGVFLILMALSGTIWGLLLMRLKKNEENTEKLSDAHQTLEVRIAAEYTPRRELEKLGDALFKKLDTIEALLHQKADKQ